MPPTSIPSFLTIFTDFADVICKFRFFIVTFADIFRRVYGFNFLSPGSRLKGMKNNLSLYRQNKHSLNLQTPTNF